MYPYSSLPQPLTIPAFYVLLALARAELHAYAVKGEISKDSLGSIKISTGRLYELITRLHDEGLIDVVDDRPTNNSGIRRLHYHISKHGSIRLQEELQRLDHALKIGRTHQLMDNPVPTDIQRLQLAVAASPETSNT